MRSLLSRKRKIRIDLTLDDETMAEALQIAPDGDLNRLVNDAVMHQIRLERGRQYVAEEEAELGPRPAHLREHVLEQWPE